MPDIGTTNTSIYAPQPQRNPFEIVTQGAQAMDSLGQIEAAKAVKGAMQPDGSIDRNALAAALGQTVAGASKAMPTLHALEQLKQAGFQTDQQGLETFQKRMALTHHLFGHLASKDKPTMQDVYEIAARATDPGLEAKKYGITLPVIMNVVNGFRGLTPEQIKQKALEIQTQAATTSEVLQAHAPRYQWTDQGPQQTMVGTGTMINPAIGTAVPLDIGPNATVVQPGQAPRLQGMVPPVPGGGVVRPNAMSPGAPGNNRMAPAGGLPIPNGTAEPVPPPMPSASFGARFGNQPAAGPRTQQPPGFSEATSAEATASANMGTNLVTAANEAPKVRLILQNLDKLVGDFASGPKADWKRVAGAFVNSNIPIPDSWKKEGSILDPKRIASQEEFNKQAYQLAQAQFAAIGGTGTDAKLASAANTSPNELMSTLGNKGVIQLLKGNQDAIETMAKAWNKWREVNGPQTYPQFAQAFNENFDPRVFMFKHIPKAEQQKYFDSLSAEEQTSFLKAAEFARKNWGVRFSGG